MWIAIIGSLVWIGYVGMDILNENNNYTPEDLFGSADEKLLIINRPNEVDIDQLSDFSNAPCSDLIRGMNPLEYKTGYLSANQAQLLLKKSENWTQDAIINLFVGYSEKPEFTSSGFTLGEFEGRFYKKGLYMKKGEIQSSKSIHPIFIYDKKASASVLHFSEKEEIVSVSDIYFRDGGRVDYITNNDEGTQGNQVKDEVLFAGVVTKNFSSYHFYERDFYASQDSIFSNGPMFAWMLNGFLELEYQGSKVLICDYIDGQDPILIMNDLNQTIDKSVFKTRLTRDFPSAGSSYFIKYLEDLIVISESENTCDKVVADFKLGNTIALNKIVRNKVFGSLPQSVSERIVTKDQFYSRSVYRGQLLETQMGVQRAVTITKTEKESVALNCSFDILDFDVLEKDGNVVALGTHGEIARFKNGKMAWSKRLESKPIGGIQLIDLHQSGEKNILLNTTDKIYLWNLDGEEISGFPINLDSEAITQVKFYRWHDKSYFLVANDNNEVMHYDARGRELNAIKTNIRISRTIDVWSSQQKLFAGFANKESFVMYDLDNGKIYREFQLTVLGMSAKVSNELFQFGFEGDRLVKINQKGLKFDYKTFNHPKLIRILSDTKSPTLIVQSANEIHLLNIDGIAFSEISLPFNEVADVFIETSNSGKTTVAIIDGLENNVYLYALDGVRLTNREIEGQTKVLVRSNGNNRIITTVVDKFIVQYFE